MITYKLNKDNYLVVLLVDYLKNRIITIFKTTIIGINAISIWYKKLKVLRKKLSSSVSFFIVVVSFVYFNQKDARKDFTYSVAIAKG